jgi:FkbM family methyltransferase
MSGRPWYLPRLGLRSRARNSDYLAPEFTARVDPVKVTRIFELGARDGHDSVRLRNHFRAEVTAFECNPEAIRLCRRNLRWRRRIRLVEAAVWDEDTEITFYPVTASRWADGREITDGNGNPIINIGASSCFRARDDYLQRYEQTRVRVPAMRLDTYCRKHDIGSIDLICMDVQGAAMQVLRGLGDRISTVRYIIAELERREVYHGQSLYQPIHDYLTGHGFRKRAHVRRDDWFGDFLYVHET